MKVRIGFVSNSSSQAFVIRGIKVELGILARALGISGDCDDLEDAVYKRVKKPLEVYSTRFFFDMSHDGLNDPNLHMVVGKSLGDLEDGVVTRISEPNDEEVKRLLEKIGLRPNTIATYIQYISNDNF